MIYLCNPNYKMQFIHAKNDIHPYEIIHPCKWITITISFKLQVQSSRLRLYTHAQAIFGLVCHHLLRSIETCD
jgi:hypothetical protein